MNIQILILQFAYKEKATEIVEIFGQAMVETVGLEPMAYALRTHRSPS